ncbi:MAG: protein phosphatase 2C domain-containing protein [Planctomycetota bacterium]|nr:protein phosphatase 2C domain-containing protein [Planctomycetota bacterium]
MKSRVLHTSKDIGYGDEYDDAFFVDDAVGRVAVADGVSSALFSGVWARIVTRTLIESGVDATDPEAFREWLASARAAWLAKVDLPRLTYTQQEKLRRVGGAFCTVLYAQIEPAGPGETTSSRYRAWALGSSSAIGDTCLLHWRDGALIASFPLTQPAEFDADPAALCSSPSRRDQDIELRLFDRCRVVVDHSPRRVGIADRIAAVQPGAQTRRFDDRVAVAW